MAYAKRAASNNSFSSMGLRMSQPQRNYITSTGNVSGMYGASLRMHNQNINQYMQGMQRQAGRRRQQSRGGGGLTSQYQKAFDEAKQANESRYQQALGMEQGLRNRVMGGVDQLGRVQEQDISQAFDERHASNEQNLASRGLYNSTVSSTLATGNEREKQRALATQQDLNQRQRLGYDMDTTGRITGLIERRQDEYPDMGQYAALAQAYGQGGAGGRVQVPYGSMTGGGGRGGMGPISFQTPFGRAGGNQYQMPYGGGIPYRQQSQRSQRQGGYGPQTQGQYMRQQGINQRRQKRKQGLQRRTQQRQTNRYIADNPNWASTGHWSDFNPYERQF